MMAIATSKPTAPSPVIPVKPQIQSTVVSSPLVDTKYTALSSLITFTEGYLWTVDYYSQVISQDSVLAGQDPGLPAQYQQYRLIRGLELKVGSPISWDQDQVSKAITASGSATVHSTLIANAGDMFAADIGDGRLGVFEITTSTKNSLLQQSTYNINYVLVYFTNNQPSRKKDLDSKVVQTVNYVRDFLLYGQNPFLTDGDYKLVQKLKTIYRDIVNNFMESFYSREKRTLLVPCVGDTVYDSYLTTFVSKILNTHDHPLVREMVMLNVEDDYKLKGNQLYVAILNRDMRRLDQSFRKMGVVYCKEFSKNPMSGSIRFSGLTYIVYPFEQMQIVDHSFNKMDTKEPFHYTFNQFGSRVGSLNSLIKDTVIDGVTIATIYPVQKDDHYVFTEAFYDNLDGKSLLEVLVINYLNSKQISYLDLYKLCTDFHNWGALERYYYLPIILVLIKSTIRGL